MGDRHEVACQAQRAKVDPARHESLARDKQEVSGQEAGGRLNGAHACQRAALGRSDEDTLFSDLARPDEELIGYLDTRVRDLSPNTAYLLPRAVDTVVDGNCTSTSWLTLGKGLTPEAIVTDDRGTGRAELFRGPPDNLEGTPFDIYFQLIESETGAVALQSGCYEFVPSR